MPTRVAHVTQFFLNVRTVVHHYMLSTHILNVAIVVGATVAATR